MEDGEAREEQPEHFLMDDELMCEENREARNVMFFVLCLFCLFWE